MKKIIKLGIFILNSVILISCTSSYYEYPYAYKKYGLNGKYAKEGSKLAKKIQFDMIDCGFDNAYDNLDMIDKNKNGFIRAFNCMKKRGYVVPNYPNNDICQHELYKNATACQKQNNH